MWKALWKIWTIDKPAMLGDWLWDVFVVQLAALLDRLTLRRIIASIPVFAVFLAYYHNIPVSPGLMLLGDLLAYIDIFSVLFLLGILSRAETVLYIIKRVTARLGEPASRLMRAVRWQLFRRRRESGVKGRKRLPGRRKDDDDEPVMGGVAWA